MDASYVSRGGQKLAHALKEFNISVKGLTCLDVGSSTGGFVDCLLQNGAIKVYSLDTAYGELAWKLRKDPRVVVIERTNILHFTNLPEKVDLVTIDVTFTTLEKILPIVKTFLKENGQIIALLKPQYEDSELALKNKGILPKEQAKQVMEETVEKLNASGFKIEKTTESPILGGEGNKEYLVLIQL